MVAAVVVCVGVGSMLAGGVWLAGLGVALAYLLGRSDEHERRREDPRPGYIDQRAAAQAGRDASLRSFDEARRRHG